MHFVSGYLPQAGTWSSLWWLTSSPRFSKNFITLPKLPTAKETVGLLIQHVFPLHSLPEDIVSDKEGVLQATGGHHKPVVGVPSPEQWPDGAHESGPRSNPPVHDGVGPCLLVVPLSVSGLRSQLLGKLSDQSVPVPLRIPAPLVSAPQH